MKLKSIILTNLTKLSFIIVLIGLIVSQPLTAQKSKSKSKGTELKNSSSKSDAKQVNPSGIANTIIAKVADENITYSDLERAFKKNINRRETQLFHVAKDSILDFLNLYINYRLKVHDAIARGFQNDSAVKADIASNRRILAESFYYEKALTEPNVNDMLSKRDRELQIAIIVKTFPTDKFNGDTLPTYKMAKRFLDRILAGADFSSIAKDSSDDPETSKNGGLVGNFITSGNTQRPIETHLFDLKPGEVYKDLIRIRDGYLIVKLIKSEPRLQVKARHILLSEGLSKDSMKVVRKADSLLSLIKSGADFSRLAEENSDDPTTAVRGGDLGNWYSRSSGFENKSVRLLPPFEDALYKLKDGQVSSIVKTEYGLHIIKRDSTRPFINEADREELKKLYKRVYFESDKRDFLDNFKAKLNFKIHSQTSSNFLSLIDTTKTTLQPEWDKKIDDNAKSQTIFTLDNKNFTLGELIKKLNSQRELKGTATNTDGIRAAITKITDPLAFDKATENLEKTYPEFNALLNEFRDGILLFKVEDSEVWSKLKFDSTSAMAYWEKNKTKYNTLPVYDITEVYVLSDTLAKDIYKFAQKGTDMSSLAEQYTQRSGYREKKGSWGKTTIKDNKLAKMLAETDAKAGDIQMLKFENGWSVVKINSIEPTRMKKFEEAISDFAPEFQDGVQKKLSENWIESIRKKYSYSILIDNIDKVINTLKKQ